MRLFPLPLGYEMSNMLQVSEKKRKNEKKKTEKKK